MGYEEMLNPDTVNAMLWETLLKMQEQAADLCPVAKVNGGGLRASITIATSDMRKSYGDTSAQLSSPSEPGVGYLGSAMPYAAAVEFGRPDMPNYPAQPYLRPARDQVHAQMGRIAGDELMKRIIEYNNRFPFSGGKH